MARTGPLVRQGLTCPESLQTAMFPPEQSTQIAALVCAKLRKTDPRVGIALCERYRQVVEEATELYEDHPGFGVGYLAELVVEAFRSEARTTYGDPITVHGNAA